MATALVTLSIRRNDTRVEHRFAKELTLSGIHEDGGVVNIGTTEEAYTIKADVANKGSVSIENLDGTNYLEVGYATGNYPNRVRPATAALIQLAPGQTQLFLKANTAAVDVLFNVTEQIT